MPRAVTQKILAPDMGIFLDRPKDAIPTRGWSDGNNARFKDGVAQTSPGWLKFTDQSLGGSVKRLDQFFKFSGIDYAIAITNTKFWYYDSGTGLWVDVTGTALTGIDADFVDAETVDDLFVFCNNVDRVKKWVDPGTGNIANLSGLDQADDGAGGTVDVQTAKSIVSFANFTHVVNTVEDATRYPQRWRWSRFNESEGWNNVSTYGQAGYADITDGPDKMQRAKRLGGDFLALYKERSIHIAQYVGPPTVWARRLVVTGTGLIAPGAVADIGGEHVLIGRENIYLFNGLNIKPIGDPVFNTFINELDPTNVNLIWSHVIYEDSEVIFGYPTVGNTVPNKAMVYNYVNGSWSFRDMPFFTMGPYRRTDSADSWDSDPESWDSDVTRWDDARFAENFPLHLAGDASGYVHNYGDGYSQDGANHNSFVVTKAIDAGRPDIIKRFFKILIDMLNTGDHTLMVEYLTVNNKNAVLNWAASKSIQCNLNTVPWVTVDIAGRWLFIRYRTNGTNNAWAITSHGYEYTERGRY